MTPAQIAALFAGEHEVSRRPAPVRQVSMAEWAAAVSA